MAENTSQTKLTPFQKLKRVVSKRSVKNLGSRLSLDKYIQPDDTDNEILFNSNKYKPDYWNISTESPPAWFDPKVTPRQLSETGGAKFKSAGEVVAEKSSVSPTTARNENSTKDKLGKHSYDHQTEPDVEPSNTTPLNFQTFVRADLKEEQIRGRFGSFSDDGWSSHSQQASEDAEDQDGNTRATDDHVQSARSGTDTGDNPTIFEGSTIQSASELPVCAS